MASGVDSVRSQAARKTKTGIYAAGDVTGRDQFVYMAAYGAKLAARNALNGDSQRYDNTSMPAVVFTDPQVARVGLSEAEALTRGYDAQATVLTIDNVPRAQVTGHIGCTFPVHPLIGLHAQIRP